jgi:hypothetical protein
LLITPFNGSFNNPYEVTKQNENESESVINFVAASQSRFCFSSFSFCFWFLISGSPHSIKVWDSFVAGAPSGENEGILGFPLCFTEF